ncbi:autophagy-related protein 18h isoform X2 [Hevea brasiliensis]|uniref:autophagy-related protein 18h isoform X2 n=1 Tax=Hevea brasiliensis TaxID=3981 RepID=UPI0025E28484|nr:autophagy-related protein 18h isoform X2 [Hevea brasiliensis]
MKNNSKANNSTKSNNNRFLPNSLKFISSCIKTASSGVRTASASVAASISGDNQDHKDQVLWASFDQLELGPSSFKHVLLLGYSNGFQVIDVEDASDVIELVSKRDNPVTFLQMQPLPAKSEGREGFRASHPLLLVVSCAELKSSGPVFGGRDGLVRDGYNEPQIYCFDALTLENKFSVLTYPVPQLGGQGMNGVNIGYGPMAVGPRWLAYASDNPLVSNTGRLSPQSLTPPLGVSPSTPPGSGSLMARYAMESSKQIASGLINLGDMGYKTVSRYCQDLIPDGSNSPVYSNSSWKVGRGATHSAETDNAGLVVVKDIVSGAVLSQFRAHTSPISALCFDPSGTLLVTASIHGNNINIFRIMPSSHSASGNKSYEWSSSHVHLYKLHRGITSAVIQDICFSHCSQWIAIVSSRGTCHIFMLSPFGGENVLQIHNPLVDGPSLSTVLSLPWWSTPSMVNQQSFPASPPSPVTLSVVSRIRNNNTGWLNTVSNAASSAAGKASVPSGAIAAVFHSCVPRDLQPSLLKNVNALEHLLVYTPCGHLVQYKLLSPARGKSSEAASRIGQGSSVQIQDEELQVNVESVQWWDVCRRADWAEKEECISGITLGRLETTDLPMETSDCEDNYSEHVDSLKSHKPFHLFHTYADLQTSSWKMPLWQNQKIHFYEMAGGENEIEKIPVREVEIRQKDLLPVSEHFHRTLSNWTDRGLSVERYSTSLAGGSEEAKDLEDAVISHSKSVSTGSAANDGSLTKFYPLILQSGNNTAGQGGISVSASSIQYKSSIKKDSSSISFKQSQMGISPENNNSMDTNITSLTSGSSSAGKTIAKEFQSSNGLVTSEASNTSSNLSNLSKKIIDEGPTNDSLDFKQFFQEGYCKVKSSSEYHESAEVSFVDNNISPCDLEKSEEDGDNDDMLGGVFAFSEEG